MSFKWKQRLSDSAWVNSVAISDDGTRLVGGTFFHEYADQNNGNDSTVVGSYGTFCYDSRQRKIFSDKYEGLDGVFAVGISGDGTVAVGGGLIAAQQGILRIYDCEVTNGQENLLYDSTNINGRVSVVSASRTGSIVAAAANELYVLARYGNSYQTVQPANPQAYGQVKQQLGNVSAVSVHPSGTWLAACNKQGGVMVATLDNGRISNAVMKPLGGNPAIPFLSIAIAEGDHSFVLGGGDSVYQSSRDEILSQAEPAFYSAVDPNVAAPRGKNGKVPQNVRWVAVSNDGSVFATVANRNNGGQLLVFNKGQDKPVAKAVTDQSPNSVSMDSTGRIIVVSDGFPWTKPANFYRFDANDGHQIWRYETNNENWPMAVSPNAFGIAAGGDDGNLYYFLP